MKIINEIVWFFGVYFIGAFVHEFIHFLHCKSWFMAGFVYFDNKISGGIAHCPIKDGEVIPYIATFIVYFLLVKVKLKKY